MRIITFTTDFGDKDGFTAMMKGMILSYTKNVIFVDISNEIQPFKIEQAEFILKNSFYWFPEETIHIGVVDPGVGGKRRGIIVHYKKHFFVGPDNGIFSFAVEDGGKIYRIKEELFSQKSHTFHGRDVFATTAGIILSKGIECIGEPIEKAVVLKEKKPQQKGNRVIGKVVHIDRFGNLITNIKPSDVKKGVIFFKGKKLTYKRCYEEGGEEPFFVIDGYGYYEISLKEKSAQKFFNAEIGDEVTFLKEE